MLAGQESAGLSFAGLFLLSEFALLQPKTQATAIPTVSKKLIKLFLFSIKNHALCFWSTNPLRNSHPLFSIEAGDVAITMAAVCPERVTVQGSRVTDIN